MDTHSRLICYDILDLGKQLQPIGMLVVLDSILNRITQNRAKGRNTFIFIDEIYLLFQHEYSANFLFTLWKRVRKYGAYCTGIDGELFRVLKHRIKAIDLLHLAVSFDRIANFQCLQQLHAVCVLVMWDRKRNGCNAVFRVVWIAEYSMYYHIFASLISVLRHFPSPCQQIKPCAG